MRAFADSDALALLINTCVTERSAIS
jgi:hypothetical protein